MAIREKRSQAAQLIRRVRKDAGLTQDQLARLAGVTQSVIAVYEGGRREPSLPMLQSLIEAAGHTANVDATPDRRLYRLADVADDLIQSDDQTDSARMRYVFEFLRAAGETEHAVLLLIAREPRETGDPRFDALLAAVAEDLAVHAGVAPPAWVFKAGRTIDGLWWASDLPSARAHALVHTPASYRRRGIMIDRHDLETA